jgi:hypothetical protein
MKKEEGRKTRLEGNENFLGRLRKNPTCTINHRIWHIAIISIFLAIKGEALPCPMC